MPNSVRIKKKKLTTETIQDPAVVDNFRILEDRVKALELAQTKKIFTSLTSVSYSVHPGATFTQIPGLELAMQSYGNPVEIRLQSDIDQFGSSLGIQYDGGVGVAGSLLPGTIRCLRDGRAFENQTIQVTTGATGALYGLPPGAFTFFDKDCPAGAHLYTIEVATVGGTIAWGFIKVSLVGIER